MMLEAASRARHDSKTAPEDAKPQSEELMTVAVGSLGCDFNLCYLICATRKARLRTCGCVTAGLLVLAVIAIAATLWSKLTEPSLPCFLSPGDTRLVSFSSLFCESITLSSSSTSTEATIYLVKETPPLELSNSFTVEESFHLPGREFGYLNYFLHPNSSFSMFACGTSFTSNNQFHVIKGKSGFIDWMQLPRWNSISTIFYRLGFGCGTLTSSPYRTTDANEYYFAFFNPGNQPLEINARMSLYRYQYSLSNLTADLPNCTATDSGDCTVSVPLNSYSSAIIVTDVPQSVDWKEKIDISWTCNIRPWPIIVLVLIAVFIILMVSALIAVFVVGQHFARLTKPVGGTGSPLKEFHPPAFAKSNLPRYPEQQYPTNRNHILYSAALSSNGIHIP